MARKRKTNHALGCTVELRGGWDVPSPKVFIEACEAFARVFRDNDASIASTRFITEFYVGPRPRSRFDADEWQRDFEKTAGIQR